MTDYEKLTELLQDFCKRNSMFYFTENNADKIAAYLLRHDVAFKNCETCEYLRKSKMRGESVRLIGKPLRYCPECGKALDWNDEE